MIRVALVPINASFFFGAVRLAPQKAVALLPSAPLQKCPSQQPSPGNDRKDCKWVKMTRPFFIEYKPLETTYTTKVHTLKCLKASQVISKCSVVRTEVLMGSHGRMSCGGCSEAEAVRSWSWGVFEVASSPGWGPSRLGWCKSALCAWGGGSSLSTGQNGRADEPQDSMAAPAV